MAKYRSKLPQLASNRPFLTEGGVESTLVFHHGQELPYFAAFTLLSTEDGTRLLRDVYEPYVQLAVKSQRGIVLETPTWRASDVWGQKMGYSNERITEMNRAAVKLLDELRYTYEVDGKTPIVLSGNVGPLGDAYQAEAEDMTVEKAKECYYSQIETLSESLVDMVSIMTTSSIVESIAVVQLARQFELPVMVSFTVETDGSLSSGVTLAQAIAEVDAATEAYASYYGINCAHPCHFVSTLKAMPANVRKRIGCIRANASKKSHHELDNCDELDAGDPVELGMSYETIREVLSDSLRVIGGCCGTDLRHVTAIASFVS